MKKLVPLTIILISLIIPGLATAAEFRDFDRAAFEQTQADGKPIVVDVAAWWCPICMSQTSKLESIAKAEEFKNLVIFHLSWGSQKDEWKKFSVTQRATLIAFKGSTEVKRLSFDTDQGHIQDLLNATL